MLYKNLTVLYILYKNIFYKVSYYINWVKTSWTNSMPVMFQDAASERAQKIFGCLDINGDGELNEDEFIRGTQREIERDFYFLKVHLGDSNRQPQSSRENLEWYP